MSLSLGISIIVAIVRSAEWATTPTQAVGSRRIHRVAAERRLCNFTSTTACTRALKKSNLDFPYLCLTVSGGHTQIVIVHNWNKFEIIGQTLDDAVGEAFDKAARLLCRRLKT